MKRNIQCDNQTCFLCKGCIKEWLPAIAANKKNFSVKKGQVIFSEGDPVKGIYFVYEGNVKVHKKWGADKELIIRFANKGAIFGHRVLGKHASHYPISATALEAGIICFIDMEFFEAPLTSMVAPGSAVPVVSVTRTGLVKRVWKSTTAAGSPAQSVTSCTAAPMVNMPWAITP
ncbi:MAG: Crp/Fnr family transcriptional regulator, partial [Mucilaginibacter sp.]|nr:Crp/Fnr family transcriptional regulator [Mucilaginibacter sp.]